MNSHISIILVSNWKPQKDPNPKSICYIDKKGKRNTIIDLLIFYTLFSYFPCLIFMQSYYYSTSFYINFWCFSIQIGYEVFVQKRAEKWHFSKRIGGRRYEGRYYQPVDGRPFVQLVKWGLEKEIDLDIWTFRAYLPILWVFYI